MMVVYFRYRMTALGFFFVFLLGGCDGDCSLTDPCGASGRLRNLDWDSYSNTPAFLDLDFSLINPQKPFDHWQLRQDLTMTGVGNFEILYSGGMLTYSELDESVRAEFEEVGVPAGFTYDCMPATCMRHFISVEGTDIQTWWRTEEARAFLGDVQSSVEALIIARSHGYSFNPEEKKLGAVRETENGFDLVGTKAISSCNPIRTDRFLLRVNRDGSLDVVSSEIIERRKGCFIV